MTELKRGKGTISRRDFIFGSAYAVAAVGLAEFLSALGLTSCTTPNPNLPPRFVSPERVQFNQEERHFSGPDGEFRIREVRNPQNILYPDNPPVGQDQIIKTALDNIQTIKLLEKKSDDGASWQRVNIPGSFANKLVINQVQDSISHLDQKMQVDILSTILAPSIPSSAKIAYLQTKFTSIPESITSTLNDIDGKLHNLPANAPWELVYDSMRAAANPHATDGIDNVLLEAGLSYGLVVPNDSLEQGVSTKREELGKMFMPIDKLDKPQLYIVSTPAQDSSSQPTSQTVAYYGEGDKRNTSYSTPTDLLLAISTVQTDASQFPQNSFPISSNSVITKIDPSFIRYGYNPSTGMPFSSANIQPMVFVDKGGDKEGSSLAIDLSNGQVNNRVTAFMQPNPIWITDVTDAVTRAKEQGVDELFMYGLQSPVQAFNKILTINPKGDVLSQALLPDNPILRDELAKKYIEGKKLGQWGVATAPITISQFSARDFVGTTGMDSLEPGTETYTVNQGDMYPIDGVLYVGPDTIVTYDLDKGGILNTNISGLEAPLREVIQNVIVCGGRTPAEVAEFVSTVAPPALVILAAFAPPEAIATGLGMVLTRLAAAAKFVIP